MLGEGAYWSSRDACFYWVDIKGRRIFRTGSDGAGELSWDTPDEVGFIVEDPKSGNFLGALRKGVARIALPPSGGSARVDYITMPENDLVQNRFNDGGIDRYGNLWAGSMDDGEKNASGNWWHVNTAGETRLLLSGFKVTNGPAFSPDGLHVYLNDSALCRTYRAQYDVNGIVSGLEVWNQFDEAHGYPDGMAFDRNGLLWIAFWDGHCVRAYDEAGFIQHRVDLPVARPTNVAFNDYNIGFVTSARIGLNGDGLDGRPLMFEMRKN